VISIDVRHKEIYRRGSWDGPCPENPHWSIRIHVPCPSYQWNKTNHYEDQVYSVHVGFPTFLYACYLGGGSFYAFDISVFGFGIRVSRQSDY
jgi:hypothetical protein